MNHSLFITKRKFQRESASSEEQHPLAYFGIYAGIGSDFIVVIGLMPGA